MPAPSPPSVCRSRFTEPAVRDLPPPRTTAESLPAAGENQAIIRCSLCHALLEGFNWKSFCWVCIIWNKSSRGGCGDATYVFVGSDSDNPRTCHGRGPGSDGESFPGALYNASCVDSRPGPLLNVYRIT